MSQSAETSAADLVRLWVSADFFIEVNSDGYYVGPLGEGSLGIVVCLKTQDGDMKAWKLPRLLADTLPENNYIELLLELELQTVMKVKNRQGSLPRTLLLAQDVDSLGYFKGGRQLGNTGSVRAEQQGFNFFIQFKKAQPPRFCLVKHEDDTVRVIPSGVKSDFLRAEKIATWQAIGGTGTPSFITPSFYFSQSEKQESENDDASAAGALIDTVSQHKLEGVWYAGLASILWDWADKSLQQSIGDRALDSWNYREHFQLWERIIIGVFDLHSRGFLHADVRPANIFCRGEIKDPHNYFLGDYGSFSDGQHAVKSGGGLTNNTSIGPDVSRGRASPFYSLERRAGVERETADTALIIYSNKSREFRVWLGWRSNALDSNGGVRNELVQDIQKYISREEASTTKFNVEDYLRRGDRIRVRDQVFKIKEQTMLRSNFSATASDGILCICEGWYATVLYDRLTVINSNPGSEMPTVQKISLSSFTELKQWSAATDLFSVGVIMLYTLYATGRQKKFRSRTNTHSDPSLNQHSDQGDDGAQQLAVIDAEFRQMMAVMESVPYLKMLWPDLIFIIKTIKEYLVKIGTRNTSAERRELYDDLFALLKDGPKEEGKREFNANRSLVGVTSNITQSVPNVKIILAHFNNNMIYFVLFIHYVLQCLHRQDHLVEPNVAVEIKEDIDDESPFSVDRIEKPVVGGAAARARTAFEAMAKIVDNEAFDVELFRKADVPDFDVRSEYVIRNENEVLKEDLSILKRLLNNIVSKGNEQKRTIFFKRAKLIEAIEIAERQASKLNTQQFESGPEL